MTSHDHERYYPNPAISNNHPDYLVEMSDTSSIDWITIAQSLMERCTTIQSNLHSMKHDRKTRTQTTLGTLYTGALGTHVYLPWQMARYLKRSSVTRPTTCHDDISEQEKQQRQQQFQQEQAQSLLKQALDMAEKQLHCFEPITESSTYAHDHRARVVTLLEGSYVGCKALTIVLYHELHQSQHAMILAQELIQFLHDMTRLLPEDDCDVLYGRSGALQTILFLRHYLSEPSLGSETVSHLVRAVLKQGRQLATNYPTCHLDLLWQWHDSWYLGAAHGVVGILHMLLQLESIERETLLPLDMIWNTMDQLAQYYCFPTSGNLDSSIQSGKPLSQRHDRLVHWCHGAPGYVLLLVTEAVRLLETTMNSDDDNDDSRQKRGMRYLVRAQQITNQVIWPRGLLKKGVGLCHGISGNAFVLAAVDNAIKSYQDVNKEQYEREQQYYYYQRAQYFAKFALDHLKELEGIPDRPYSLYEGLGGLCALTMALSELPEKEIKFPLYVF